MILLFATLLYRRKRFKFHRTFEEKILLMLKVADESYVAYIGT